MLFNGKYLQTRLLYDSLGMYICTNNAYDEKGNKVSQIDYNRDGSVLQTLDTVNEYDSHGNLVTTTTTTKDSSGKVTQVSVTVYEYKLVTR